MAPTAQRRALDFEPDLVITSYHGMPVSYLLAGDPYHCQCLKTTRLVREHLGWPKEKLMVTFQSRFGREEWLKPYTAETLEALPGQGVKKIAILAPAFSVDCIETLEELAITGREQFMSHVGEKFAYIPCLNDSDAGMAMLEQVVRRELGRPFEREARRRRQRPGMVGQRVAQTQPQLVIARMAFDLRRQQPRRVFGLATRG